jgi:transposase
MITNKTINIQIPIETDEYLRQFIFKNINYARKVWNDFVEEANKYKGDLYIYNDFDPYKFKVQYFIYEDLNNIYNEYCVGISEQISKNVFKAIKELRNYNFETITHNKKYHDNKKLRKLRFHGFDNYYGSFKVHTKAYEDIRNHKIYSRVHILDSSTISFRVRGGKGSNRYKEEKINIKLKEYFYEYKDKSKSPYFVRSYKVKGENAVECWFNELDIKEICFIHKLGKFYIQLSINVTYKIEDKDIKSRQLKAGIDTGIHNPAVLYYGKGRFIDICMPEKVANKIHYLERRAKRLQNIMDRKMYENNKHVKKGEPLIYSKNYWKVRYKFRKVWNKIVNIRRNWIYKTCKFIVTNFQYICVDKFKQPSNEDERWKELPNRVKRHINYTNRFHCMYTFNETLKHMAEKYGCTYIESPPNTTKTCSFCNKEYDDDTNDLHIRKFACHNENCEMKYKYIDRDYNAARNCYKYIKKCL